MLDEHDLPARAAPALAAMMARENCIVTIIESLMNREVVFGSNAKVGNETKRMPFRKDCMEKKKNE